MSKDHSKIQENSNQDDEREENNGPKTEIEEIDEGYQTPTSEEHKIPQVAVSCPPPPPRKRRRLAVNRRNNMRKVAEVFKGKFLVEPDLELFFESFAAKPKAAPPPPASVPGTDPDPELNSSTKKRHIDE